MNIMFGSTITFLLGLLIGALGTYFYMTRNGASPINIKLPFSFKIEREEGEQIPAGQPAASQQKGIMFGNRKPDLENVQVDADEQTLQKVLAYVSQNVEASPADIKEAFGVPETTAKMYLETLRLAGKLSLAGERAGLVFYKTF